MRNFLGKTKQASSTIAILSNQQCGDEKYLSISDEETRLMSGHQKSDEKLLGSNQASLIDHYHTA
jgi:hypothetical protein